MAKIPDDLEDLIVSDLPWYSMKRFRRMCKRWTLLLQQKFFVKSIARNPHFILCDSVNCYLVKILAFNYLKLTKLDLDVDRKLDLKMAMSSTTCDGCIVVDLTGNAFKVWNPFKNEMTVEIGLIDYDDKYKFCIGYDRLKHETESCYKLFGYHTSDDDDNEQGNTKIIIYECKLDVFKFLDVSSKDWSLSNLTRLVSLKGSIYWIDIHLKKSKFCVHSFNFSEEKVKTVCFLPPKNENEGDCTHVLGTFMEDQLSLLRQSLNKIEILVTKRSIVDLENTGTIGEAVEWSTYITMENPDFPRLSDLETSFLVDDMKKLTVCTFDEKIGDTCFILVDGLTLETRRLIMDPELLCKPFHLAYIPGISPFP